MPFLYIMPLMVRTDVTAVKLHNNLILAGIGSYLNVFNKASSKLLQKLHCLNGQKIYGIIPLLHSNKILVFGGKQFTVVVAENDELVRLNEPIVCDDWLHSGIWITDVEIALLTAHNVVQIWATETMTLKGQYACTENSILYSGALHCLQDEVLVLAGTVFSEVIVHACKAEKVLHHLKGHRGVIFSISCDPQKGLIVTTSDDRSLCIWGINNMASLTIPHDSIDFWQKAEIVRIHEIYGHTARVMRNCITKDMVVSVGEDSVICFWNYDGKLLKKIATHQNSGIWSVDADDEHLVTGGGDGGVILHPLTTATDHGETDILNIDETTPKKIIFTARRNIVILNDKDDLIYYDVLNKTKDVYKLKHESTYKLLSQSSCKQIIAVVDMCGNLDVFIETCKDKALLLNVINCKVDFGKVISLHWAGNRHLVLACDKGLIKVLASNGHKIEEFAEFTLPACKERWLTAANIDPTSTVVIAGDRCGNIHVFKRGTHGPLKTFSKVHGRYGPTSIVMKQNGFVTTGRDGSVKYFDLNAKEKPVAEYMSSKDLEFQWVEKFIDKNENMICGFQERVFVVYDLNNNSQLVEVACGGGHRSWDVVRYIEKINDNFEECVKFIYVKNADIHLQTFQFSKTVSTNVVSGSHSKEINCFRTINVESSRFCVSGGEDTTLRISSLENLALRDKFIFKHLSNVRTLKTKHLVGGNKHILVSAGGRAQICIKLLSFMKENGEVTLKSQDLVDYMIKGPEKERKGKQSWKNCAIDFDPETRIMDIDILQEDDLNFIIFAGCSDALLRVFLFNLNLQDLKLVKIMKNHKTCILKTQYLKFQDHHILVTCSTRGEIIFWAITNLKDGNLQIEPIFTTVTNKSGINSFDVKIISDKYVLFGTGGDDNAIHLNLLEYAPQNEVTSFRICDSWVGDKYHCSQVTGLILLDGVMLSTSIDQRVTMFLCSVAKERIGCFFLTQMYSDVSDIQGMDLMARSSNTVTVCVFGKGVEMIEMSIPG